jgi:hypothetical protein
VFVEMPTVSRHVVDKSRRHSAELAREWWLFAHTGSRFHSSDFQQKGWKAPILFDWPHHDRAIEKANSFSPPVLDQSPARIRFLRMAQSLEVLRGF